jgi:hypothetical protein
VVVVARMLEEMVVDITITITAAAAAANGLGTLGSEK